MAPKSQPVIIRRQKKTSGVFAITRVHFDALQIRRSAPENFMGEPLRESIDHGFTMHAGLPGRLLHDFRRGTVRNLERAGVPRATSMQLVGHKTESIYKRYAIKNDSDRRDGVATLAQFTQRAPVMGAKMGANLTSAATGATKQSS